MRQAVAGSFLLPLAGMVLGSMTCDLVVSTLMPRLAASASHLLSDACRQPVLALSVDMQAVASAHL